MYTPLVRTPDEYKTEQSRAKREWEKQKIIIKCYKFYYEDFIIYFPVGGLDIKTNQEPITRLLNELFEYHQLTQIQVLTKKN